MDNFFYDEISRQLANMKKKRQMLKEELRHLPDGRLMISSDASGVRYFNEYYKESKRYRKGIGKNESLIYKMAHKQFVLEKLNSLDNNIEKLEEALSGFTEMSDFEILKKLPANYDILKPEGIINLKWRDENDYMPHPVNDGSVKPRRLAATLREMMGDEIYVDDRELTPEEWFTMPYCENSYYSEYKKHTASNGLKTRSKSESAIIDLYRERNLYYHYDELFSLDDKLVSPDGTIVLESGDVFIHEHAGLWTEDYIQRNARKLERYEKQGFYLGKNLLLTFDNTNGYLNIRLAGTLLDDMLDK